jgi:Golgi nucleoside diphosphatase
LENSEAWTARIDPGLATYSDHPERVYEHLLPLIDFAKMTLSGREKEFGDYPIYLKATGGMRELPFQKREEILTHVRKYLSNKEFCPFFFREDFARIISGELICLQMDYIYLVCNVVCMYV